MADGDGEPSGVRRRETPASVEIGLGGQLVLLRAGGAHPTAEPLRRQVGLGGAKSPGARPDDDLAPGSAEPIDGGRDGVRAEQAAAHRRPALVGVECGRHAGVERIRGGELDVADDGQRQQHGTPGRGADVDQPDQLIPSHEVEQRRGGDEARAGEIVRT